MLKKGATIRILRLNQKGLFRIFLPYQSLKIIIFFLLTIIPLISHTNVIRKILESALLRPKGAL